ncbi:MAG TPA: hypothetical protein VHX37_13695 [Acidobacteriaceae bacterium]|jgi:hypothetical protein|nr:hypothetical protein [Acidobacteriaceae bacterium]
MAIHSITTMGQLPERTQAHLAACEARISGAKHESLRAFRGLAFAVLIEASMFLFGAVGWEVWRMMR